MAERIPVIIDCDPGLDDFFALMVAGAAKNLDIRGVTAVAGNVSYKWVTKNALDIAELLGLDCPVARGAQKPMLVPYEDAAYIHGADGLGGAVLPPAARGFDPRAAWDLIYDEAVRAGGDLHLIAIGPLTNVAIAFLKYPKLPSMLAGITLMGGSATRGNANPYAEFNIWGDPHAAALVFKSGVKVLNMVGLNATLQGCLPLRDYMKLVAPGHRMYRILEDIITFGDKTSVALGRVGQTMHDAITVMALTAPGILTFEPTFGVVETRSGNARGQTVLYTANRNRIHNRGEDNVNVAMELNIDVFIEQFGAAIAHYA